MLVKAGHVVINYHMTYTLTRTSMALDGWTLEALDWLHDGGGVTVKEAAAHREQVRAERLAKKYWWEA